MKRLAARRCCAVSAGGSAVPGAAPAAGARGEARISVDFKDADIVDVVRLLAEVGGFQVVVDPGISCKLTLKLKEVRWTTALDLALKTCGLGQDEESGIVRVAPVAKLTAEHAAQRKLDEEQRLSRARCRADLPALVRARGGDGAAGQEVPLAARRGHLRRAHQHADRHRHRVARAAVDSGGHGEPSGG